MVNSRRRHDVTDVSITGTVTRSGDGFTKVLARELPEVLGAFHAEGSHAMCASHSPHSPQKMLVSMVAVLRLPQAPTGFVPAGLTEARSRFGRYRSHRAEPALASRRKQASASARSFAPKSGHILPGGDNIDSPTPPRHGPARPDHRHQHAGCARWPGQAGSSRAMTT
jgi:hypothetical protein